MINVFKKNRFSSDAPIGRLRNIEDFHLFGESSVDLSALSGDEIQRSIVSGSGSNLIGSDGKEVFQISYYEDYNNSISDAYAVTTTVDGGKGFDRLIVDTENSPFDVGFVHDGEDLVLVRESDDSVLLFASGIESFAGDARALDRDISDFTKPSLIPDGDDKSKVIPETGGPGVTDGNGAVTSPPATSGPTSGDDLLIGTPSPDTLKGLGGDDTFIGGLGKDILEAGIGINKLAGGPGKDIYKLPRTGGIENTIVLDAENDKDKVIGFDPNRDSILFSNISEISASTDKLKRAKKAGHNVILKVSRKNKSTLFYKNDGSERFSQLIFSGTRMDDFDLGSLMNSSDLSRASFVDIAPHLV